MRNGRKVIVGEARPFRAVLLQEPEQYREGRVEFCGRSFLCDPRALIPRFETEFLVRETARWCVAHDEAKNWRIADIGTGSGVIAISIAAELPHACVSASDISVNAVALARHNALRHLLSDRIRFASGYLLEPLEKPLDIIIANLPYIPTARIPKLDPSVRDFEPHAALDGGKDGFKLYRELIAQIADLEQMPDMCIFEIDADQGGLALHEIARRLPQASCRIHEDSSGLARYVKVEFP